MNITKNNNINFGQVVPTKPLLKAMVNIHNFDEGKELYLSTSSKVVGNIGYHKRATILANNIVNKNENIRKIFQELTGLTKEEQQIKIDKLTKTLGENIDVIL